MPKSAQKTTQEQEGLTHEPVIEPGRPALVRRVNAREILRLLRNHGPCSRADLVRKSGLSAPSVSSVVASLVKKGLVEQIGLGSSNGGRPPSLLRFNRQFGYVVGVDIGGSAIRVGLADLNGSLIGKRTVATHRRGTPERVIGQVAAGVEALKRQHRIPRKKLLGLGAAAPGITDVRAGIVLSAPNLSGWRNVPLRQLLEAQTGIPVAIENDVNLGALGESWRGAARDVKSFVFLAVGTGVGAGIFVNGRLYHGADWAAGEIGYLNVPGTKETPLAAYRPGALESTIGGKGIVRAWLKACNGNRKIRCRRRHAITATEIFDRAEAGEPEAREILRQTARILAQAIANLCVILNPSLIVFGGRIGTHHALFQATRPLIERNEFARPRLAPSLLGAEAQLFGAIRLALNTVEARVFP